MIALSAKMWYDIKNDTRRTCMNHTTALIGMSGGVDSSVAAYLMLRQGYTCQGATMRLFENTDEDAAAVCRRLGIPFHVLDNRQIFRDTVMADFVRCYETGLTPNPCIVCNRTIKFGMFLEQARSLGCDCVVTGHYARIRQEKGRYLLCKAADRAKDQSYFLYGLTQDQLAHSCFPLGELTKAEVRQIAEEQGFINAKKGDSQDICFVPDGDYFAFLQEFTGKSYKNGDFLDLNGKVVGTHQGAVGYTLGQRKGLGLAMGAPVYVCGKDMEKNTVTVGPNEALFTAELTATDWNWIAIPALTEPLRCSAKARSRMTEQPATVYPLENGLAKVVFDEPQRAITPGQAVVLYNGDTVLGGGTII
jgi:tRNA-specific 2-thiouridylase